MHTRTFTMGIGLLAILMPLRAGATNAEQDEQAFKLASQCPMLFGAPGAIERNKKAREEHLQTVVPGEHMINLTHTGPWNKPEIIRIQGVELMATAGLEGKRPSALVEVSELPEGMDCEPGLYELGVDNSVGGQAHVLAIVEGAVLLEYKDELRFIQTRQAETPVFRMIWRSTWTIAAAQPTGSGPTPGRAATSTRHSASANRPKPASTRKSHRATSKSTRR